MVRGLQVGAGCDRAQGQGFSLEGVGSVPPVHSLQHFAVDPERDGGTEQQQSHMRRHGHDAEVQEAEEGDHEACEDHS